MQTIFELLFALVLITTWLYVVKKMGESKPEWTYCDKCEHVSNEEEEIKKHNLTHNQ